MKDSSGSGADDDYDDAPQTIKRSGGIFGWTGGGGRKDDDDARRKNSVRNRLASVLDKDRAGWGRSVVRMEFAAGSVYEGRACQMLLATSSNTFPTLVS